MKRRVPKVVNLLPTASETIPKIMAPIMTPSMNRLIVSGRRDSLQKGGKKNQSDNSLDVGTNNKDGGAIPFADEVPFGDDGSFIGGVGPPGRGGALHRSGARVRGATWAVG